MEVYIIIFLIFFGLDSLALLLFFTSLDESITSLSKELKKIRKCLDRIGRDKK